jgi:hypothetical protein
MPGKVSILDAIGARGGETFDHHRLKPLDHHATAHLDRRRDAKLGARDPGVEAEFCEQRREVCGAAAPEQQGHLDAGRRDRRHDRAFDVAAALAVDQRGRAALGAGRGRVEVEEPGPGFHGRCASLRDRHSLARRDGGNDEIGLRREIGMRSRQRDAVRRGVIAQGGGLTVVELDVVGGDPHILLAQVLAENAADLAITDEADIPLVG